MIGQQVPAGSLPNFMAPYEVTCFAGRITFFPSATSHEMCRLQSSAVLPLSRRESTSGLHQSDSGGQSYGSLGLTGLTLSPPSTSLSGSWCGGSVGQQHLVGQQDHLGLTLPDLGSKSQLLGSGFKLGNSICICMKLQSYRLSAHSHKCMGRASLSESVPLLFFCSR